MEVSTVKTAQTIIFNIADGGETIFIFSKSPSIHKSMIRNPSANITPRPADVKASKNRSRFWWTYFLISSSVVIPLVILTWWIIHAIQNDSGVLSASVIGGHLSYTQAKAIDFVCGALLVPLLMVLLDYL